MSDGELTDRQRELVELLPEETSTIRDDLGLTKSSFQSLRQRARKRGVEFEYHYDGPDVVWTVDVPDHLTDDGTGSDDVESELTDLEDVDRGTDPDPSDLTEREQFIATELQTGATVDGLTDELDERPSVVHQHLRDLKREGWQVYIDETAGHIAIEGDHLLRSSEHKGTRTRKANRWWELRHNELVREFRGLERPTASMDARAGHEDWVTHVTDLHAGDRVRRDDGTVVYETDEVPDVVDHITRQSLALSDKHNSRYDAAHLLWGGDFITNEGIYEGQFEDLDAWLDEQHDALVAPLIRQLKAFSERFPTVQVVCIVGNHGQHRASGTSRQANADLILYKHIRNTVAELQEHAGLLENVAMQIGDAAAYRNFEMRGGEVSGHLRHGQNRRPQAETAARAEQWSNTLLDHDFDVAAMGHHHVAGRIPWDGPPIICSPSPKPAGEFVERLGGRKPSEHEDVATAFGVSDDGLTSVWPIDTRNYDQDSNT